MSRLSRLALASALVFAAAPALAYEPEIVGLDYTPSPFIPLAAGDRAAPPAPGWEPEIAGLDAAAYAGGYLSFESVDPIALIDPGPGSSPDLAARSSAACSTVTPAATAVAGAAAGPASGQLACSCPCK